MERNIFMYAFTHSLLYMHIPFAQYTHKHTSYKAIHTHTHTHPHYTANTTIVFAPSCHPQHTYTQYTPSLTPLSGYQQQLHTTLDNLNM